MYWAALDVIKVSESVIAKAAVNSVSEAAGSCSPPTASIATPGGSIVNDVKAAVIPATPVTCVGIVPGLAISIAYELPAVMMAVIVISSSGGAGGGAGLPAVHLRVCPTMIVPVGAADTVRTAVRPEIDPIVPEKVASGRVSTHVV